ncbi:uncharacterized protein LRP34_003441 [Phaethornis superciliosus]
MPLAKKKVVSINTSAVKLQPALAPAQSSQERDCSPEELSPSCAPGAPPADTASVERKLRGRETDSELNLAPGQVALSSSNYLAQRLGGCNNHLKGEIKAPLNGVLCSRPHLIERGPRAAMEKGLFSVEWLARSSRRGAQSVSAARQPGSPPVGSGSPEAPAALAAPRDRKATDRSSPGYEAEEDGGAVPGRPRTKFSAAQLQELERSFREQRYIGASEKQRLAAALNLSQSQIKTWFQNRRMKFKRQTQDARVEALFSGLFLPSHCCPDIATSSYSPGMDISVSATSTESLHPAMPSPAFLLPSVPAHSLQPVLLSPTLLMPPSPGLTCYSSVIPTTTLTDDHKGLMFQPYLPSF